MDMKAKRKNSAAAALGRRGGKRRLETLTVEQRSAIARIAARTRWAASETAR